MTNINAYIRKLLEAEPLRKPLLQSVIQSLQLPRGSSGLDAGCGIGLQTLLLAEAVGPQGQITGIDILPELLSYGKEIVAEASLSDRILFREGDVSHLPFDDTTLDWAWSVECVGYPAGELMPLLNELIRVVRPGGDVILLGWSSQQLLPGYPLLEARLNATCSGYIPFLKEKSPDLNFMRASHWFQKAGLEEVRAQTFVGEISVVRLQVANGSRSFPSLKCSGKTLNRRHHQRIGDSINSSANLSHQISFWIFQITMASLPVRCSGVRFQIKYARPIHLTSTKPRHRQRNFFRFEFRIEIERRKTHGHKINRSCSAISQFVGSSWPDWTGRHLRPPAITVQCIELPELSVLFPFSALVYKTATPYNDYRHCSTVIRQHDLDCGRNPVPWRV